MRRLLWIPALVLALGACSDDESGAPGDQPAEASESTGSAGESERAESPENAVERSYRSYVDAFLSGDGATAYNLLTKRCRDLTPLSEFAEISEGAAELYGSVDYRIKSIEIDGKAAMVDGEYAVAALNQGGATAWRLEGGEWRNDKCD